MNINPKPNKSFNVTGTNFTELFLWDGELVIVKEGEVIGRLESLWG